MAKKKTPVLPDSLYLDYSRTGNRARCEVVMFERDHRVATLTLAECLENRGRFLPALIDTITNICAERGWQYPAHDVKLNNFYGRELEFDLRTTTLAWDLATADFLLGEKLPVAVRREIRGNVERRMLQPFRAMVKGAQTEGRTLRVRGNHNSVDVSGIVGTALTLVESPEERAWFITAGEYYIQNYLKGFTPDGYCSEGVGYWNYGFSHYVMLGEAIRQATRNQVDLFAADAARQPALFGLRTEIINGVYPGISDGNPNDRADPHLAAYVARRLGLAQPRAGEIYIYDSDVLTRAVMFAFPDETAPVLKNSAPVADSPLRAWFPEGGLLICRPAPSEARFAVALKGGHNAEQHNQNDVGSFSVVMGKSTVICDPGAEHYTGRTFSKRRYESKVLNSYGHAAPLVAGKLQSSGASARAVVQRAEFSDAADTLAFDLRSAYAVPELEKLERTFMFRRNEKMSLTIRDEVRFAEAKTFETALITWSKWKKLSANELRLGEGKDSVRVKIETGGVPFKIHAETLDENVVTPQKPIRIGIALKSPVKQATVTLRVAPE